MDIVHPKTMLAWSTPKSVDPPKISGRIIVASALNRTRAALGDVELLRHILLHSTKAT